MEYLEVQNISNGVLDILDTRIAKLHHLIAFDAYQMVMLLVTIRLFELSQVFAKLMLSD